MEFVDGVEVTPWVILGNERVQNHRGGIVVAAGGRMELTDLHQGSLTVEPGGSALILGTHQGSLHVSSASSVEVQGSQQGSSHIAPGGKLVVTYRGKIQGSLHNAGNVENAGSRGGTIHGDGVIIDAPGSRVIQPKTRNGMTVYEW